MEYVKFVPGEKYPVNREDRSKWEVSNNSHDFEDCGIILDKDIVVVDIDDLPMDKIDKLIKAFDIKTQYCYTDRGIHFYYKKPKRYKKTATGICNIGFKIEHKVDLITHKIEGRVVRDLVNRDEFYELPWFFKIYKDNDDLQGLVLGDSRYNKLLKLSYKMDGIDNKYVALNFINNNIFAEPIDEKDINNMANVSPDKTKVLESLTDIARDVAKNTHAVLFHKVLYCYIGNSFTSDTDEIRQYITKSYASLIKSSRDTTDVLKSTADWATILKSNEGYHIQFDNGILKNGTFYELDDCRDFTPYTIHRSYKKDLPVCQAVEDLFDILGDGDADYRRYLIQMFAGSLIVDGGFRRKHTLIHFLVGDGGNGKGTMMGLYRRAMTSGTYGSVKMEELSNGHNLNSLHGMLANISEEVQNKAIKQDILSIIKNITAWDPITLRQLYKGAENDMIITSSLLCTSNHILPIYENNKAIDRRFVWIPVDKPIGDIMTDEQFDGLKSEHAADYFLKLLVEESIRMQYEGGYIKCDAIQNFTHGVLHDDDIVEQWFDLTPITTIVYNKPSTVYDDFKTFYFEAMGEDSPLKQNTLTKMIKNRFGVDNSPQRIDGKIVRVFKPNLNTSKGKELMEEMRKYED